MWYGDYEAQRTGHWRTCRLHFPQHFIRTLLNSKHSAHLEITTTSATTYREHSFQISTMPMSPTKRQPIVPASATIAFFFTSSSRSHHLTLLLPRRIIQCGPASPKHPLPHAEQPRCHPGRRCDPGHAAPRRSRRPWLASRERRVMRDYGP